MFRTCSIATLSLAAAFAQPLGGQPNPNLNLKSTEVLPDHRVVFRIYAPKANAVTLTGDFVTQGPWTAGAMQKDDEGIWLLTVGPLVPDFQQLLLQRGWGAHGRPEKPDGQAGGCHPDSMFLVPGPETWINWRPYLRDFTQLLFR